MAINEQVLRHETVYDSEYDDRYALLDELMIQYGRDVVNLAYLYVKDRMQAEDIAQDAFLKVFTHMDQFQHKSSLKTWIYTITINCAKDYLRSGFFRKWLPRAEPLRGIRTANAPSAEEKALASIEKQEIWHAVFELPVKYREVVILFYREGCPISEISEVLDLKEETVRTRLKRARSMLEQKIGKEEGANGSV